MQSFLSQKQYLVARGLLEREGKYLVVRDNVVESFLEYYALPGDFVRFGQDPEKALIEVFYRQTGLTVTVGKPFYTFSRLTPNNDVQIIEIYYQVLLDKESLGKDISETAKWLSISDTNYYLSDHFSKIIHLYCAYYGKV